jgi:cation diffusion facilitator family transporter
VSGSTGDHKELRALQLTVAIYVVILGLKLAAYFITGVMVLLAEALHTLADILISGFLLVAMVYSRRKADDRHMFGHERAQNVAALVAATLFISFTSFKLAEEAIPRLFRPAEADYQNVGLALGVVIFSMVVAAVPLVSLVRQRGHGAAAKAQMMELINDQLGLLAALAGTLFVMWDKPLGDPIAALAVAVIITINAIGLFRENLPWLIGSSPGPEFVEKARAAVLSVDGVLDVHSLRAEKIGPNNVHVDLHLEVEPGTVIEEADRIAEEARDRLDAMGSSYCAIHVDPYGASRETEVDW